MNALNKTLHLIAESLQDVESHLRQIAVSSNPAPIYWRPLSDYRNFDWASIGAIVLKEDRDGATEVEWNGQVFTRRSAENHFDAAVWYSRCVGKDSDGCDLKRRLAVTATGFFQNSTAIGCFLAPRNSVQPAIEFNYRRVSTAHNRVCIFLIPTAV
jgi:hypothetical protein